jgi:hypothetical protein
MREMRQDAPVRWRVDYLIFGEKRWASNAVRFDTEAKAEAAGKAKFNVWFGCDRYRVVPDTTPDRELYVPDPS